MNEQEFTAMVKVVLEAENIKAGEVITEENVRRIRPGFGLHPKHYKEILGKTINVDLEKGTALSWE